MTRLNWRQALMVISNQKGSIDLLYAFLCFSLLGLLSFYTLRRVQQWTKLKKNLDQIICIKRFHKRTDRFIKDINLLNKIIVAENIIQLASLFFPSTWISQRSLSQIKKATKKFQDIKLGSYLYFIGQQAYKKCRFDPRVLKTPYQISLGSLGFKRDKLGTTQLRSESWKYCHPLSLQIICSKYKLDNQYTHNIERITDQYFLPRKL